jgi:hypothetical protein
MMKYINPKNGRAWETDREDITPGGFINVLDLKEGDEIECWHTDEQGTWRKFRNGMWLQNGRIHLMGAPPPRRTRKKKRKTYRLQPASR